MLRSAHPRLHARGVLCTASKALPAIAELRRAQAQYMLPAGLHAPPSLTPLGVFHRRDYLAKIADVGIARVISSGHMSSMTSHGTFAWAAPELLLGEAVTTQADIYSYGVCLWVSPAWNLKELHCCAAKASAVYVLCVSVQQEIGSAAVLPQPLLQCMRLNTGCMRMMHTHVCVCPGVISQKSEP